MFSSRLQQFWAGRRIRLWAQVGFAVAVIAVVYAIGAHHRTEPIQPGTATAHLRLHRLIPSTERAVKKTYSVTAVVRSLNKPEQPRHVLVQAEDEEDAKKQARNKIQKSNPHGTVTIGSVRE
ncbi:hypothetical protein O1L55_40875 [Streptomyces albulus]|nr:hypothetical protein [Streptomyces noursei]